MRSFQLVSGVLNRGGADRQNPNCQKAFQTKKLTEKVNEFWERLLTTNTGDFYF